MPVAIEGRRVPSRSGRPGGAIKSWSPREILRIMRVFWGVGAGCLNEFGMCLNKTCGTPSDLPWKWTTMDAPPLFVLHPHTWQDTSIGCLPWHGFNLPAGFLLRNGWMTQLWGLRRARRHGFGDQFGSPQDSQDWREIKCPQVPPKSCSVVWFWEGVIKPSTNW